MHDHQVSIRRSPRTRDVVAAAFAAAGIIAAIASTAHAHTAVAESHDCRATVDARTVSDGTGAMTARWCAAAVRAAAP